MTGAPETLEHLDVDPALRPLARALALRGPGWWVLVQLELRKAVDTRWGRWLLLAVLLLAVAAAVRTLTSAPVAVDLSHHVREVFAVVGLVLPVVGVLATAGEWSRRTAASTFALVPQRGRVLSAKVGSALLLTTAVSAACALVALATAAQAAQGAGVPVVLGGGGEAVLVALAATALATLVGSGLGALAGSTWAGVAAVGAMAALHVAPRPPRRCDTVARRARGARAPRGRCRHVLAADRHRGRAVARRPARGGLGAVAAARRGLRRCPVGGTPVPRPGRSRGSRSSWSEVMSASVKPRLAGRQPSSAVGCPG